VTWLAGFGHGCSAFVAAAPTAPALSSTALSIWAFRLWRADRRPTKVVPEGAQTPALSDVVAKAVVMTGNGGHVDDRSRLAASPLHRAVWDRDVPVELFDSVERNSRD